MLIVFDLDDTLYLERDYVKSGFTAVGDYLATRHGVHGASEVLWRDFQAGVRGDAFNRAAAELGFSTALIPTLVAHYRNHRPEISLAPDAARALAAAGKDARLGLVTDGYAPGQRQKIAALNLEASIDAIVVTGEHGAGWAKPGAQAFAYLQSHFHMPPERCIYVGDNPRKDFIAPLALGWRTARICRPGGIYAHLPLTADDPTPTFSEFDAPCLAYLTAPASA